MIRFDCPRCGEALETRRARLNRLIRCPECTGKVRVPQAEENRARRARQEREQRRQREERRPRRRPSPLERRGPSPRNLFFGCLFVLFGLLLVAGGLSSGKPLVMITAPLSGLAFIINGGFYLTRR